MGPYGGPPQALFPLLQHPDCYTRAFGSRGKCALVNAGGHHEEQQCLCKKECPRVSASEAGRLKTIHLMCSETFRIVLCVPGCRVGGVLHRPHRATGEGRHQAAGGRRSSKNIDQTMARLQGSTGRPLGSGEDHHLKVCCSRHLPIMSTPQESDIITGQLRSSSELPWCETHSSLSCHALIL